MGCENSKHDDTLVTRHRPGDQYGEGEKGATAESTQESNQRRGEEQQHCCVDIDAPPAAREAFAARGGGAFTTEAGSTVRSPGGGPPPTHQKSNISSANDGNSTAGLTCFDRGSSVGSVRSGTNTNGRSTINGRRGLGESHTSQLVGDEGEDSDVMVYMTAQNSPNSIQALDTSFTTGGSGGTGGGVGAARPFDPRQSPGQASIGNNSFLGGGGTVGSLLGVPNNGLLSPVMSIRGANVSTTSSFGIGCISYGQQSARTSQDEGIGGGAESNLSAPLKPFSISQFELDQTVGSSASPSNRTSRKPSALPDNNMGDTDQEHTEARFNRQVARKESFAKVADEPGNFMRSVEETFRQTKMRAVAALSHEVDHDELARVALKAENPKTITACAKWLKTIENPVPRTLKASTLNELRILTTTEGSIHYGRSLTGMLVQHQQQQLQYQQGASGHGGGFGGHLSVSGPGRLLAMDGGSNRSERMSGTQQSGAARTPSHTGLPRNASSNSGYSGNKSLTLCETPISTSPTSNPQGGSTPSLFLPPSLQGGPPTAPPTNEGNAESPSSRGGNSSLTQPCSSTTTNNNNNNNGEGPVQPH